TDNDALAVGRRAGGAIRVGVVRRLLAVEIDVLLPDEFAVLSIQAEHATLGALGRRLSDKDAIAPYNRGRVAGVGELDFPADVIGRAPGERQVLFGGVTHTVGAAPARPVLGGGEVGKYEESNEGGEGAAHGKPSGVPGSRAIVFVCAAGWSLVAEWV